MLNDSRLICALLSLFLALAPPLRAETGRLIAEDTPDATTHFLTQLAAALPQASAATGDATGRDRSGLHITREFSQATRLKYQAIPLAPENRITPARQLPLKLPGFRF